MIFLLTKTSTSLKTVAFLNKILKNIMEKYNITKIRVES